MEAASCGALGKTIGIGVRGIDDAFVNQCAHVILVAPFFLLESGC